MFFDIKSSIVLLLLIFSVSTTLTGQEASYPPTYHIGEDGSIYWNKALPVYLSVSPYPDGQGPQLKSKNPNHSNPMYLDTEGVNYIRSKYAVDKNTKKIVDPLVEVLMPIIADGEGPSTKLYFENAQRSKNGSNKYFGSDLTVRLTSEDKLSGVDFIMYRLDNNSTLSYSGPITVSSIGEHTIYYYGVDNVGNKETTHQVTFYIDLLPPSVTHNINGMADGNILSQSSKIYFESSDDLSGVDNIYYKFDDEEYRQTKNNNIDFTYLNDGDHVLEYYATDKVGNSSSSGSVTFYLDKTAPITASDILGDRFVVKDKVYFSGRTKMKLTAVDNKIGVKAIMYSIDGKDFEEYDQPFYLPSIPGEHSIKYYSLDRLSNRPSGSEKYKHNISLVFLDLTGPKLTTSITGPEFKLNGKTYIGPESTLTIKAADSQSGLKMITYSVDGTGAETIYTEPIKFNSSGIHSIEVFGYDNVNNRNIADTEVYVDLDPPMIFETFSSGAAISSDGLDVYPDYVTLFLSSKDQTVGTSKIYYSVNGKKKKLYAKPITGFLKDKKYQIDITAIDMVGNESTRSIEFITSPE